MFKNGWESNQENIIIGNEVYDLDQMQFGQLLVHFLIPQLCGLLFMSGYPDWIILDYTGYTGSLLASSHAGLFLC